MIARNKTKKMSLVRLLHRSKVRFSVTLTHHGDVSVAFFPADGSVQTLLYGLLDSSYNEPGMAYFQEWDDFAYGIITTY